MNITRRSAGFSLPVSLGLGLLAGLAATPAWSLVLRVIHATPFGTTDPIFSRDIGFYVFTLPAISAALGFLSALATLSLLLLIPLYWLRGDIVLGPRRLRIEPSAGMHLASLLGGALPRSPRSGSGWWTSPTCSTRPPARWWAPATPICTPDCPALRVSAVVAVLAAVAVLVGGFRRQLPRYGLPGASAAISAVALLGRGLVPAVVQKFVVAPTELTRETPYLSHHIAATRQAWGLDSVETRELERRGRPHPGRHPGQRADDRERAALGPRAAAADLRPAPGDPHLLRLRLGGRRPLLDRRQVPPGAALARGSSTRRRCRPGPSSTST